MRYMVSVFIIWLWLLVACSPRCSIEERHDTLFVDKMQTTAAAAEVHETIKIITVTYDTVKQTSKDNITSYIVRHTVTNYNDTVKNRAQEQRTEQRTAAPRKEKEEKSPWLWLIPTLIVGFCLYFYISARRRRLFR